MSRQEGEEGWTPWESSKFHKGDIRAGLEYEY